MLVIGSGLAGLTAACRAQELGARVLIVEKSSEPPGWNNSRISTGVFHIALTPLDTPAQELLQRMLDVTAGATRIELARALVQHAPRTLQWLIERGARFTRQESDQNWVAAPIRPSQQGLHWQGYGMDFNLNALYESFIAASGQYYSNTRAIRLKENDGRVIGAEVTTPGKSETMIRAQAVLLADGGFQGNPDMVRCYISPSPERLRLRATDTGAGDGIRLALALGAQCINMQYFYGHCLHRDSVHNDDLWPYPVLDSFVTAGIVIDNGGQRIVDEGSGGVCVSNVLARRQDPQDTWVIFDKAIWTGPGIQGKAAPNLGLRKAGASIWQANTLVALAKMIGADPSRLETTVTEYNSAVTMKQSHLLPVPRTSSLYSPWPIIQPPFYALPLVPGITHTMGGLLISPKGKVLDHKNHPIPGLFAAGATAGGLGGGPRAGYVGGLVPAAVFGLLAGETIAEGK